MENKFEKPESWYIRNGETWELILDATELNGELFFITDRKNVYRVEGGKLVFVSKLTHNGE